MFASSMANTAPALSDASNPSGTGNKLAGAAITVAGVAALVAALVSFFSIWLQLKSELPYTSMYQCLVLTDNRLPQAFATTIRRTHIAHGTHLLGGLLGIGRVADGSLLP